MTVRSQPRPAPPGASRQELPATAAPGNGAHTRAAVEPYAPLLSVVVVTYNVRHLLAACLRSVLASKASFPFEVCVVDTGTDGSAALV
ncbi:MAG TPA: glycosyltransferase, partial [Chloroflexota bacterium]|nr:glycosyltransferase [Chloroflexota bacterium]